MLKIVLPSVWSIAYCECVSLCEEFSLSLPYTPSKGSFPWLLRTVESAPLEMRYCPRVSP